MANKKGKKHHTKKRGKKRGVRLGGSFDSVRSSASALYKSHPEIRIALATAGAMFADNLLFGKKTGDKVEGGIIPGIAVDDKITKNLVLWALAKFGKKILPIPAEFELVTAVLASQEIVRSIGTKWGMSWALDGVENTQYDPAESGEMGEVIEVQPTGQNVTRQLSGPVVEYAGLCGLGAVEYV